MQRRNAEDCHQALDGVDGTAPALGPQIGRGEDAVVHRGLDSLEDRPHPVEPGADGAARALALVALAAEDAAEDELARGFLLGEDLDLDRRLGRDARSLLAEPQRHGVAAELVDEAFRLRLLARP